MKVTFFYNTEIGILKITENGLAITEITLVKSYKVEDIVEETQLIREAYEQLNEYFQGKRNEFTVKMQPEGTAFQNKVWNALREIPYGQTRSYGEIAKKIGNSKASRAVGMANNKNPILIMIPCHRVIGSNGKLVGYAGGLNIKEKLLKLESQ